MKLSLYALLSLETYWDDDQIKQISMDSDASICTRIGIPDVKATFGRAILFAFFVPVNLPLLHKSWLALQSLNLANSGSYCLNFSILSFVLCFVGTVDVSDKNYAVTL